MRLLEVLLKCGFSIIAAAATAQEIPCEKLPAHQVHFHCSQVVGTETIHACTPEAQTAKAAVFKTCVSQFSIGECLQTRSQCFAVASEVLQESLSCPAILELKMRWNLETTPESVRRCIVQ